MSKETVILIHPVTGAEVPFEKEHAEVVLAVETQSPNWKLKEDNGTESSTGNTKRTRKSGNSNESAETPIED